jgi:hypothetical protein
LEAFASNHASGRLRSSFFSEAVKNGLIGGAILEEINVVVCYIAGHEKGLFMKHECRNGHRLNQVVTPLRGLSSGARRLVTVEGHKAPADDLPIPHILTRHYLNLLIHSYILPECFANQLEDCYGSAGVKANLVQSGEYSAPKLAGCGNWSGNNVIQPGSRMHPATSPAMMDEAPEVESIGCSSEKPEYIECGQLLTFD